MVNCLRNHFPANFHIFLFTLETVSWDPGHLVFSSFLLSKVRTNESESGEDRVTTPGSLLSSVTRPGLGDRPPLARHTGMSSVGPASAGGRLGGPCLPSAGTAPASLGVHAHGARRFFSALLAVSGQFCTKIHAVVGLQPAPQLHVDLALYTAEDSDLL